MRIQFSRVNNTDDFAGCRAQVKTIKILELPDELQQFLNHQKN